MPSQFATVIKRLVAGLTDVGFGVGVIGSDEILAFYLEVFADRNS
jgi:hypothetical protein